MTQLNDTQVIDAIQGARAFFQMIDVKDILDTKKTLTGRRYECCALLHAGDAVVRFYFDFHTVILDGKAEYVSDPELDQRSMLIAFDDDREAEPDHKNNKLCRNIFDQYQSFIVDGINEERTNIIA